VAPTKDAMVVRRHLESGERRLDLLRWGLIPSWTKDLRAARKPINARSETAGSSGMFKAALAQRRCLVPVNAFYEWKVMPDRKQPYAIARTDGTPLAFAGVWEGWRSPDSEVIRTFHHPDHQHQHGHVPAARANAGDPRAGYLVGLVGAGERPG
jgi:putative SOS response-associated peptidase YedK